MGGGSDDCVVAFECRIDIHNYSCWLDLVLVQIHLNDRVFWLLPFRLLLLFAGGDVGSVGMGKTVGSLTTTTTTILYSNGKHTTNS